MPNMKLYFPKPPSVSVREGPSTAPGRIQSGLHRRGVSRWKDLCACLADPGTWKKAGGGLACIGKGVRQGPVAAIAHEYGAEGNGTVAVQWGPFAAVMGSNSDTQLVLSSMMRSAPRVSANEADRGGSEETVTQPQRVTPEGQHPDPMPQVLRAGGVVRCLRRHGGLHIKVGRGQRHALR